MVRILLARHGETAWNAAGRLQGHTDIELNDRGRDQARELADALRDRGVTEIVTSDLARARQTGELVAHELGLAAPRVELSLRERRFGVFEGLTRDQCAREHPAAWKAWLDRTEAPPGGEARDVAVMRIGAALAAIASSARGGTLVVSHGGIMRLWLMDALGITPPPIKNGTTFALDFDGTRFALVSRSA